MNPGSIDGDHGLFPDVDVEELAEVVSLLMVGRCRAEVMPACRKIAGALKSLPLRDCRSERLCRFIDRQFELLEDEDGPFEDGGRAFGRELLAEMLRLIQ